MGNRQIRLPRRQFIAGSSAAASAALIAGIAGCGDDDGGAKTPAASPGASPASGSSPASSAPSANASPTLTPKRGGRWLALFEGYAGSQDPQLGSAPAFVTAYAYDPLIFTDNVTRELSGAVIEKWEQPDQQTVVLHVRDAMKFFNVAPVNGRVAEARDVVYMLKSMNGTQYPGSKVPFPRAGILTGVTDISAPDAKTVKLTLTSPRSDIVTALGEMRVGLIPEGFRETVGDVTSLTIPDKSKLIGTGPFYPDSLDPNGQTLWKRNPDYWNKSQPYLDEVQATVLTDQNGWVTAFAAGQNYYLEAVTPQTYDLAKRAVQGLRVYKTTRGSFKHIGINTRVKPLDDQRVRQALALVFDKPGIGNVIYGTIEGQKLAIVAGPLSNAFKEAIPQAELANLPGMRSPTDDDIKQAKALIAAAGISDANPVTLSITTPVEQLGTLQFKLAAEHLVEQVSKYLPGLKVAIDPVDYTAMLAKVGNASSGYHLYIGNWILEPSAVGMLSLVYNSTGGRNFTGFKDPDQDAQLAAAYRQFDDAQRLPILRGVQQKALVNWSHIPIDQGLSVGLTQPFVENLKFGSVGVVYAFTRFAWLNKT